MFLLIGCPIHRAWMFNEWIEALDNAVSKAGIEDIGLIFVVNPDDEATLNVLDEATLFADIQIIEQSQVTEINQRRVWNKDRLLDMVELRNSMLRAVRLTEPNLFLSLDSDILLNENAVVGMLERIDEFDAIGSKAYMTPRGYAAPNYATTIPGSAGLRRPDFDGYAQVEVLMAIKLMKQSAYWVDYAYHGQGEDIGYSINCKEAGLKFGWDGRYPSKHVMNPTMLHERDERCGY